MTEEALIKRRRQARHIKTLILLADELIRDADIPIEIKVTPIIEHPDVIKLLEGTFIIHVDGRSKPS